MKLFIAMCITLAAWPALAADDSPLIDNERVIVWRLPRDGSLPGHDRYDAVVVTLGTDPSAHFVARGEAWNAAGDGYVIDLKEVHLAPYTNSTGYPLAFPRPGKNRKVAENAKVAVWDYTWAPGVPTPMHFHDKDVVVVYVGPGSLKSTTPDGKSVTSDYKAGDVFFNAGNRTHTETMVKGAVRAIVTELK